MFCFLEPALCDCSQFDDSCEERAHPIRRPHCKAFSVKVSRSELWIFISWLFEMLREKKHSLTHIPSDNTSLHSDSNWTRSLTSQSRFNGCVVGLGFCHSEKVEPSWCMAIWWRYRVYQQLHCKHTHTRARAHTWLYHVWLRKAASECVPLGRQPYAGVQMSKPEQKTPPSCTHSLMSCLDRPVLDVWNVFMCFTDELKMCVCVFVRVYHSHCTHRGDLLMGTKRKSP